MSRVRISSVSDVSGANIPSNQDQSFGHIYLKNLDGKMGCSLLFVLFISVHQIGTHTGRSAANKFPY